MLFFQDAGHTGCAGYGVSQTDGAATVSGHWVDGGSWVSTPPWSFKCLDSLPTLKASYSLQDIATCARTLPPYWSSTDGDFSGCNGGNGFFIWDNWLMREERSPYRARELPYTLQCVSAAGE